jgi:hypothetical protein
MPYVPYPHKCTRAFREAVLARYPALRDNPAYLRIMEYLLFAPYRWDGDHGRVLFGHDLVAKLVGRKPVGSFRAQSWIDRFSQQVLELHASDYRYVDGKARTVKPDIDPVILELRDSMLVDEVGEFVSFLTGRPVSERSRKKTAKEYETMIREEVGARVSALVDVHPAQELLRYLNDQPHHSFEKLLRQNWERLMRAALELPDGQTRDHVFRVLLGMQDFRRMIYGPTEKTARIYAQGINLTQLPKELRLLAVSGTVHLDLSACQLAIVAKLWDIPRLKRELTSIRRLDSSLWTKLAWDVNTVCNPGVENYEEMELVIDPDRDKPLMKMAVYSITYGMSRRNVQRLLRAGTSSRCGLDEDALEAFMEHPLIRDLLEARRRAHRQAARDRRLTDAFGREIRVSRNNPARAGLAQQVQSFELQLMLAALPGVEGANGDISVIYWLHDGVALWFTDRSKRPQQLARIVEAVQREADRLGIPTWVEVSD